MPLEETFNQIPRDLAGYQLLCDDTVKSNDLAIPCGWINPSEWRWAGQILTMGAHRYITGSEGTCLSSEGTCLSWRIYRLNPVPKQSDSHERDYVPSDSPPHLDFSKLKTGVKLKAETYDDGKDPLAYLPWEGVRAVARVQAYGHKKYKDYNNYRKGMEEGRNLSCALRHIADYLEGQSLDKESGQSHLAHAACRILFVLQNQADGVAIDDRHKKGTNATV